MCGGACAQRSRHGCPGRERVTGTRGAVTPAILHPSNERGGVMNVFVSSRDAPTLAITTTDLKPSGYPTSGVHERGGGS